VWRGENLTVVAVPMRNLSFGLRRVVRLMADHLRTLRPDVIHAQWLYECSDAALKSGIPTLVTARDAPWRIARVLRAPYWWYRAAYAQLVVLPRVRHLSTLSPYMVDQMRRLHGYRRPVHLVPNGMAVARMSPCARPALRHAESPCVFITSQWDDCKNVATAFHAFALLRRTLPGARLVLYGKGLDASGAGWQYAREHALLPGLEFRGHVEREVVLNGLRGEADLLLHSAREESFCMSVLDAMAQGVPCVGGKDSGAVPWLLDHGSAGCLVDVNSAQAMAEGILGVLSDAALYERTAAHGWQRARSVFSLEAVASQYLVLLRQIAGA
jgi:glycosyltransferase involved in cell wall biosynthesis